MVDHSLTSPLDEALRDLKVEVFVLGKDWLVDVAAILLGHATRSAEDDSVHILHLLLGVVDRLDSAPWAEELRVAISSILPLSTAVSPAPPPTGNFIVNLVVGSRASLLPAGLPGGSCRGWRSPPLLPVGGDRSGWSVLPVLGLLLLPES